MATHADIGVAEPGSPTMKVATVTLTRNSTSQHQELLTLADPESTNGLARVLDSTPASTTWGLAVRPVGGGVDYTHDGAVTVSTVAGPAAMYVAHSSYATAVSADNDIVAGVADLRGRQQVTLAAVHPALETFAASTVGVSTLTQIVSSNATLKTRVYAVQISSTGATQNLIEFYSGSRTTLLWGTRFSSAVQAYNIAVTPPAYLFSVSTGANLALHVPSTSADGMSVNVSYFREP